MTVPAARTNVAKRERYTVEMKLELLEWMEKYKKSLTEAVSYWSRAWKLPALNLKTVSGWKRKYDELKKAAQAGVLNNVALFNCSIPSYH